MIAHVLAVGMTAWLSACVHQSAEVASYRRVVDLGDSVPSTFRTDQAISLNDALRLTIARNERLSIEGETFLQAMIDRQRAAASLLPTLDIFGNLTFREKAGGGSDGTESGSSTSKTSLFDGGIGAQYNLLTGLTDFRQVRAAELTIEQRQWLLLDLRESIEMETARAYYGVLLGERLVQVITSSLAVQDERLREIRGRQAVGFARPLDVAQIESQASETRVTLLDARNDVANARAALSLLTGVDATSVTLSDEFVPPTSDAGFEHYVLMALENRQDLAAAGAAASASRDRVDAEIGRFFPTISVNLDYFLTRDSVPSDRDWNGLLSIHIPLFSAGRIEADVRTAWSEFRQDVLLHSLTRREIQRDIATAYNDLTTHRVRVLELENQLRAGSEALRQAEASYGAGLGTNLERITAQDLLLRAQVRLASEEFTGKIAHLALARAAGVLTAVATGFVPDSTTLPPRRNPPESPFIHLPSSSQESAAQSRR